MTVLRAKSVVKCPKTGAEVNVDHSDGCACCSDAGPSSLTGKYGLRVACRYGKSEDLRDSIEELERPELLDPDIEEEEEDP